MELKTVDIKGKAYVPVTERIKAFWEAYPDGKITTIMLSNNDGVCMFEAEIYKDRKSITPDATGHAREVETSSYINKTSYIENCETSAVGRALGILGIGIDADIASAEEVGNAIYSQTTTIDKNKAEAFKKYVANHNLQEQAEILLGEYGYEKIEDVKLCDYIAIGNTLKKEVKQWTKLY